MIVEDGPAGSVLDMGAAIGDGREPGRCGLGPGHQGVVSGGNLLPPGFLYV